MHEAAYSDIENRIRSLTLNAEKQHTVFHLPLHNDKSECCYNSVYTTDPENGERIQKERLMNVLEQLQKEREDNTFSRNCLFCKKYFVGNRSVLLSHLVEQHNFFIGAPDNIVFINELLNILETMLKNLQCFFCEKIFKNWMTLKEHMRKKQHKRINPDNKSFDRFYVINYLEQGKRWVDVQQEDDDLSQDGDEREMDVEWQDENSEFCCLFCEETLFDFEQILLHMKDVHQFDFKELKRRHNLNFYSQVKLINYIRKKMFEVKCINCCLEFVCKHGLAKHMTESGHISILPESDKWDQPMYYFTTFENDNFLCALDVEENDCEGETLVYPEDTKYPLSTILFDENIRRNLLQS